MKPLWHQWRYAINVVGVGLIIGVIPDSLETASNSSNDVLFTATSDPVCKRKAAKKALKEEKETRGANRVGS